MTVDDTTLEAAEIMAAIGKAVATTSPESYPIILAALGRYRQALADAGLIAPAPLTEETETDQIMEWGGPVAVIERRRRWVTDWFTVDPADAVNRAEGDGRAFGHE